MSSPGKVQDKKLFQQPPPVFGECPICMIRMPVAAKSGRVFPCCGNHICIGCFYSPVYDDKGKRIADRCPYCKTPDSLSEEEIAGMIKKREGLDDAFALYTAGCCYSCAVSGYPQDYVKALELWHRAGEAGCPWAYNYIGKAYTLGEGVEVDEKKAVHYHELAAILGDPYARHNLGNHEEGSGNIDRALKHYMIAIKDGCTESVEKIKGLYCRGAVRKHDYAMALMAYRDYIGEVKSEERDRVANLRGQRYY